MSPDDPPITGKTLVAWGYKPGAWFAEAIAAAEQARLAGQDTVQIRRGLERVHDVVYWSLIGHGTSPLCRSTLDVNGRLGRNGGAREGPAGRDRP